MKTSSRLIKRSMDLTVAGTAVLILSPLMAVIAIIVRLTLGSPVLFKQFRPGLKGRPFTLIKFRSMVITSNAQGSPLPDADRLTAVGRFLRSSSLDELPELFNVLRGNMSLVGPRPLLVKYLDRYTPEQSRRHEVLPGITGWAQVKGRNSLTWEERFDLDLWYVDNQSLSLDIKILLMTVASVLKRDGISQPGQATMEEFWGTHRPGLAEEDL